jgi:hypothetical protein
VLFAIYLTSVILLAGNRYLEYLNGLAIIPFPLRYGFFLTCSLFIQVYAHLLY